MQVEQQYTFEAKWRPVPVAGTHWDQPKTFAQGSVLAGSPGLLNSRQTHNKEAT